MQPRIHELMSKEGKTLTQATKQANEERSQAQASERAEASKPKRKPAKPKAVKPKVKRATTD